MRPPSPFSHCHIRAARNADLAVILGVGCAPAVSIADWRAALAERPARLVGAHFVDEAAWSALCEPVFEERLPIAVCLWATRRLRAADKPGWLNVGERALRDGYPIAVCGGPRLLAPRRASARDAGAWADDCFALAKHRGLGAEGMVMLLRHGVRLMLADHATKVTVYQRFLNAARSLLDTAPLSSVRGIPRSRLQANRRHWMLRPSFLGVQWYEWLGALVAFVVMVAFYWWYAIEPSLHWHDHLKKPLEADASAATAQAAADTVKGVLADEQGIELGIEL